MSRYCYILSKVYKNYHNIFSNSLVVIVCMYSCKKVTAVFFWNPVVIEGFSFTLNHLQEAPAPTMSVPNSKPIFGLPNCSKNLAAFSNKKQSPHSKLNF
jgi:hypothetical protein